MEPPCQGFPGVKCVSKFWVPGCGSELDLGAGLRVCCIGMLPWKRKVVRRDSAHTIRVQGGKPSGKVPACREVKLEASVTTLASRYEALGVRLELHGDETVPVELLRALAGASPWMTACNEGPVSRSQPVSSSHDAPGPHHHGS